MDMNLLDALRVEGVPTIHKAGDRDRDLLVQSFVASCTEERIVEMVREALRGTYDDERAVGDLMALVVFRLCNTRTERLAEAAARRFGDRFIAALRREVLTRIDDQYRATLPRVEVVA